MGIYKDELFIRIEHDDLYEIIIGINTEKPYKKCDIFIPVSISIYEGQIDNNLFMILKSLFGIMLSSIIISRLGTPQKRNKVIITLDSCLQENAVKMSENILTNFMISRSIMANLPVDKKSLEIKARTKVNNFKLPNFSDNKVIIPVSGGLDSTTILYHYLKNNINVTPVFVEYESNNISSDVHYDRKAAENVLNYLGISQKMDFVKVILNDIKKLIPWKTRMYEKYFWEDDDVQDRDDWDYYGRNALISVLMIFYCIVNKASYIALGHTKEGIYSIYKHNNNVFYDRCGSSIYFIAIFNNLLNVLFNNRIKLITPLIKMTKGSIVRYLLKDPTLFSKTHSCISHHPIEDGICFSCFDKMTGLLSNILGEELFIDETDMKYIIYKNNFKLTEFSWFPESDRYGFWSEQLKKLLENYPYLPINLVHSIFSPYSIISSCKNIIKNKKLLKYIPYQFYKIQSVIEQKTIEDIHHNYTKSLEPKLPNYDFKNYLFYKTPCIKKNNY